MAGVVVLAEVVVIVVTWVGAEVLVLLAAHTWLSFGGEHKRMMYL